VFRPQASLLMSQKTVLRTAQDIFVLDNAFFLIEGHPSISSGRGYDIDSFPQRLKPHIFLLLTDGLKAVPFKAGALLLLKLRWPAYGFAGVHQREAKAAVY
jgi:hypothetical protein